MGSDGAVKVGLIGFGTIGTGVVKLLQRNAQVIAQRLGFPLRLVRIADVDTARDRRVDLSGIRFDADAWGLIRDPEVEIVIELVGGYDVAKRFVLESIGAGKHVVTANKALLALHGAEVFAAASQRGVDVAFEASVGGGIPILRSIREGLAANRIERLYGILNGTTNYMLSEMEETGEPFEVVLKRAQELGYAEADPSVDVDGVDAAHKLALLTAMAFGAEITFKEIPTEGIRGLEPVDFETAREFGYRVKLLGIAKSHRVEGGEEERLEVRVHPTMIPATSLLASVDGAMNAVAVHGDAVGPTFYYGAGAGEMPTASAVVADLMEIAREIRHGRAGRVAPLSTMPDHLERKPLLARGQLVGRVFLRFTAVDEPGVLSHITGALAENGIGIESLVQKGRGHSRESVPILVLTHRAPEAAVVDAIESIDRLPDVTAPTLLVRIEEDL
ncbi:MAG: homoserine dehydrogenase [Proteobacteria bacterium]|nr:homoserine dehydrogenase [Pseudomonadota bacterium]